MKGWQIVVLIVIVAIIIVAVYYGLIKPNQSNGAIDKKSSMPTDENGATILLPGIYGVFGVGMPKPGSGVLLSSQTVKLLEPGTYSVNQTISGNQKKLANGYYKVGNTTIVDAFMTVGDVTYLSNGYYKIN